MHTSTHTPARRAPILAAAASLLLAPCLFAQTSAPEAKDAPVAAAPAPGRILNPAAQLADQRYSIKFDGGDIQLFSKVLREKFPKDNFVFDEIPQPVPLPAFELRNVRAAEIGRTVEFLTRGEYKVEIAGNEPEGNIWRIGPVNKPTMPAATKMRSVPAPSLFSSEESLAEIRKAAEELEMMRLEMASRDGRRLRETRLKPLKSEKIFVIIGDEDGVTGLQSLINAAEQRLANEVAAKVAAYTADAPKVRAVLAPHVFADEVRRKQVIASLRDVENTLKEIHGLTKKVSGSENVPVPWADSQPHPEQKIFVLRGTEAGIAGMESVIKAAEQLAAEEDALRRADRMKYEALQAEEKAALKAAEKAAKEGKSEQ